MLHPCFVKRILLPGDRSAVENALRIIRAAVGSSLLSTRQIRTTTLLRITSHVFSVGDTNGTHIFSNKNSITVLLLAYFREHIAAQRYNTTEDRHKLLHRTVSRNHLLLIIQ